MALPYDFGTGTQIDPLFFTQLQIDLSGIDSSITTITTDITALQSEVPAGMTNKLDASVRLASNATAKQYGVFYQGGGNGLWVYSPTRSQWEFTPINGADQVVDTTSCRINGANGQAMAASTRYFSYAVEATVAGGFVNIDHSTTSPVSGDPLGATVVSGYMFKNDGTRNERLIGAIDTDSLARIWLAGARGVFFSGIASYYQRQRLNYQIKVSGGNNSVAWQEINASQYITAFLWGDGAEPSCILTGQVSSDTAGATVSIGVSIDNENPPYDFVDVYCGVANTAIPFAVNASSGDYADQNVRFGIFMKNSAGTGVIANGTLTLNLNQ